MKLQVLGIGKVREPFFRDGIEEYRKRIGKYLPVTIVETGKERTGEHRDLEAAYSRVRPDHVRADLSVALDARGRVMSSEELAGWLEETMHEGVHLVSFLIGGPHGLPERAVSESKIVLSLSSMTLPHQMARLLLMEQVYRALTIIRGEPYHK